MIAPAHSMNGGNPFWTRGFSTKPTSSSSIVRQRLLCKVDRKLPTLKLAGKAKRCRSREYRRKSRHLSGRKAHSLPWLPSQAVGSGKRQPMKMHSHDVLKFSRRGSLGRHSSSLAMKRTRAKECPLFCLSAHSRPWHVQLE